MSSRKTRHKRSRHSTPYVAPIFLAVSATHVPLLTDVPREPSGQGISTLPIRPSHHFHPATQTSIYNSHPTYSPTYHALTPYILSELEPSQLSLHQNPAHLHNVQTQYTNQLEAGFNTLGVELPAYTHTRIVQGPIGLTPSERFEAHSTYPYQQYNSYQPITPQTQHVNTAHQSKAQHGQYASSSVHVAASNPGATQMDGRNVVYFAPQQEYYPQTTVYGDDTGPGNALAAVGTQFDGHVPSEYTQTF